VTGTNGKTTTAYITSILLSRLGYKTAFLGTIGNGSPFELKPSINTTESAVHIYKNLDKFYKEGYEYVSMEVSSHGISLNRIQGIEFYSVIFTNLTHDHLNFHKTFENYEKEKFRLFTEFKSLNKIINASNEIGISWLKKLPEAISYMVNPSITRNNFITAKVLAKSMLSQELLIKLRSNSFNIKTNLIGSFNIENLLASLSCIALIEKDIVKLQNLDFTFINIPGRMELYKAENTPLYIIDYAHTPDGIDKILKTLKENLKESLESKLVVLFGFGGGRDISTRSEIVKLIFQYADKVIYTIDNPRFEPLDEIFSSAFKDVNPELLSKVQIIFNRSNAILITSKQFTLNDTIAVLGKGAEKFQEVMGVRYHYMDKEEVKKVI
ncbi:MAG: UDP-N-acetylmuramyl-tripeptide synthetase, partial [Psittacicella sp.]